MKYITYFKKEIICNLQYRSAAVAGIFTQVFWAILLIMIYKAFYTRTTISDIQFKDIVSYVWLEQAYLTLIYINTKDNSIISSIKDGNVAYELCRPYNVFIWWYIRLLAKRYAQVILRSFIIIIIGLLLPAPFNLSLPHSITSFLLFLISLLFGSLIVVSINILIHFITFFTLQDNGISSIINHIAELFSGQVLPIPLLPQIIKGIAFYLPFRLIGDLPFRIYSNNINYSNAISNIFAQIIWIFILSTTGYLIMKKALKKVSVQGG